MRFCQPPPELRRFFTTFYHTEIKVPGGGQVSDALQPEWGGLRMFTGECPEGWIADGEHLSGADFVATGPSSRSLNFRVGTTRFWGIGLLPLGWARFIGLPAADHANLVVNGRKHASFAAFRPLADQLIGCDLDQDAEFALIVAHFMARLGEPSPDDGRIVAIHTALVDPEVGSVADLVEQSGIAQRTVERLCHRHFGFSPKVLLRRQRFMRSLTQFMLDPALHWIGAMDSHYHDQAQFVRDFHQFIGMTPGAYAAMPHPIIAGFMRERLRVAGAAAQTLDRPEGGGS